MASSLPSFLLMLFVHLDGLFVWLPYLMFPFPLSTSGLCLFLHNAPQLSNAFMESGHTACKHQLHLHSTLIRKCSAPPRLPLGLVFIRQASSSNALFSFAFVYGGSLHVAAGFASWVSSAWPNFNNSYRFCFNLVFATNVSASRSTQLPVRPVQPGQGSVLHRL